MSSPHEARGEERTSTKGSASPLRSMRGKLCPLLTAVRALDEEEEEEEEEKKKKKKKGGRHNNILCISRTAWKVSKRSMRGMASMVWVGFLPIKFLPLLAPP